MLRRRWTRRWRRSSRPSCRSGRPCTRSRRPAASNAPCQTSSSASSVRCVAAHAGSQSPGAAELGLQAAGEGHRPTDRRCGRPGPRSGRERRRPPAAPRRPGSADRAARRRVGGARGAGVGTTSSWILPWDVARRTVRTALGLAHDGGWSRRGGESGPKPVYPWLRARMLPGRRGVNPRPAFSPRLVARRRRQAPPGARPGARARSVADQRRPQRADDQERPERARTSGARSGAATRSTSEHDPGQDEAEQHATQRPFATDHQAHPGQELDVAQPERARPERDRGQVQDGRDEHAPPPRPARPRHRPAGSGRTRRTAGRPG